MPLRHMVLVELRPETPTDVRDELVARLRELPELIDAIRDYEVHVDAGLQDGNATVGIVATFDDADGWRQYGPHPAHQAVVKELIAPNAVRRVALQAEVPAV